MATTKPVHQRRALPGHEHVPLPGERGTGRLHPETSIEVTVVLRRASEMAELPAVVGARPLGQRRHLSLKRMAELHGARPDDLAQLTDFARAHGLTVVASAPHRRTVTLRGSAAALEAAFGVELEGVEHERGRYHRITGAVSVPEHLGESVVTVLGLNSRPVAQRHRIHHQNSTQPYWTVPEMAKAYGFPQALNGRGQVIGLVELGGGYHEDDLAKFFAELALPAPKVTCISVDGTENSPAAPELIRQFLEVVEGKRPESSLSPEVLSAAQATVEVTMDIQLAAALAPGAEIIVYMATNTEQGIYNAVSRAIADHADPPSAISISWGEPENGVSDAYVQSVDDVLRDAALLGVTVCASSGDAGAMNGSPDGKPAVNFPASSPHALSCGGSSVKAADGVIADESAWNCTAHSIHGATGGGVSRRFATPEWQSHLEIPLGPTGQSGRGVPDVAGPADPHSGCAILVGGERCAAAGTSAVAPLWAALVACMNEALDTRCGYLTPLLYNLARSGSKPLRDVLSGDNGVYKTGPGWNACTGLGTPIATQLLEALRK